METGCPKCQQESIDGFVSAYTESIGPPHRLLLLDIKLDQLDLEALKIHSDMRSGKGERRNISGFITLSRKRCPTQQ